jgi:putative zinc finger/helix-turn-helix YgiT family protein
MTCSICGAKMSSKRENYKYTACGLDYVTLMNIEVRRCKECGEFEAVIPKIEELHRVIAQTIAKRRSLLRGCEIRFLRKYLGLSGADAAEALSVGASWLSRCENDRTDLSKGAERLLRLMVLYDSPTQCYPLKELLAEKANQKPAQIRLDLRDSWQAAA